MISLDYSETSMAAAGHQAEAALHKSMEDNKGDYIVVVECSIPLKDDGIYCKIAGKTALEILKETAPGAAAIVAIGSCASWGGVQSAAPNPTGATGVDKIIKDKPIINLPGCPASPYNVLSTILYYLTLKKLPELDAKGRPKFAYGRLIHENCERRPHFDAGRFAEVFGDDGHRDGYCLYKLGCKGPETYANCPIQLYGDVGAQSWPVGTGHPCFGCVEEGVGFTKPLFEQSSVFTQSPPGLFPGIYDEKSGGITAGAAAVAGAIAGAAAVGAMKVNKEVDTEEKSGSTEETNS